MAHELIGKSRPLNPDTARPSKGPPYRRRGAHAATGFRDKESGGWRVRHEDILQKPTL
jgi:hypothetical protein